MCVCVCLCCVCVHVNTHIMVLLAHTNHTAYAHYFTPSLCLQSQDFIITNRTLPSNLCYNIFCLWCTCKLVSFYLITPLGKLVSLRKWRKMPLTLKVTIWKYPHRNVNLWVIIEYMIFFSKKLGKSIVSNPFPYEDSYTQKHDFSKHQEERIKISSLSTNPFTQTHYNEIWKVALSMSSMLCFWPWLRITLQQY